MSRRHAPNCSAAFGDTLHSSTNGNGDGLVTKVCSKEFLAAGRKRSLPGRAQPRRTLQWRVRSLLVPIALCASACVISPRIPPPSPGTRIRIEMVVTARAREGLDLATYLRQAITRRIATHRAIVLDDHDRGEAFPSLGYLARATACADARSRGVEYVLQIDASLGGNAGPACGTELLSRVCEAEPYTVTRGELVMRLTNTATCQDVAREHRDAVMETGPQAESERPAVDDLVNAIATHLDRMLP